MPASIQTVKKELSLPPGYWQIFSYGRLTELPTAKQAIWIRAYLRRVVLDDAGQVVDWTNEVEFRDVPVGELVAWDIGTIFDANTLRVLRPQPISNEAQVTDIRVAFTNDRCTLRRRYDRVDV